MSVWMKSRGALIRASLNLDDKHVSRGYLETIDKMFVRIFQITTNQMDINIQNLIHGCWKHAIRSCSSCFGHVP